MSPLRFHLWLSVYELWVILSCRKAVPGRYDLSEMNTWTNVGVLKGGGRVLSRNDEGVLFTGHDENELLWCPGFPFI